jgi:hypothetical protein
MLLFSRGQASSVRAIVSVQLMSLSIHIETRFWSCLQYNAFAGPAAQKLRCLAAMTTCVDGTPIVSPRVSTCLGGFGIADLVAFLSASMAVLTIPPMLRLAVWVVAVAGWVDDADLVLGGSDVDVDEDVDLDVDLDLKSSVLVLSGLSSDVFAEADIAAELEDVDQVDDEVWIVEVDFGLSVLVSVKSSSLLFAESAFLVLLEVTTVLEAMLKTVDELDPPWASESES